MKLAHSILPHLSGIQNNKGTLQTSTILDFVKQNAAALSKDQSDRSPWVIVSDAINKLTQEAAAIVPLALEPENIVKSVSISRKRCMFMMLSDFFF